jgi:hypothetical protein
MYLRVSGGVSAARFYGHFEPCGASKEHSRQTSRPGEGGLIAKMAPVRATNALRKDYMGDGCLRCELYVNCSVWIYASCVSET